MIPGYIVNILSGYLLGSIPFGLVVGYAFLHRDIREMGSGKTGATNVLRTAGKLAGALVVIGDISKGAIPSERAQKILASQGVGEPPKFTPKAKKVEEAPAEA